MQAHDLTAEPDLADRLILPDYKGKPERAFLLRMEAFDWNCPQHITQRYTLTAIGAATDPLRQRLAELEAENTRLCAALSGVAP